jgi:protein phosphatase
VLNAEDAVRSPLKDILSSAIGAPDATPVVSRVDVSERGCVLVFCTDGLTKHVTNDEIESFCARGLTAEELGRALVDLALERGGSDNITIVVAQAPGEAARIKPRHTRVRVMEPVPRRPPT